MTEGCRYTYFQPGEGQQILCLEKGGHTFLGHYSILTHGDALAHLSPILFYLSGFLSTYRLMYISVSMTVFICINTRKSVSSDMQKPVSGFSNNKDRLCLFYQTSLFLDDG